MNEQGVHPEFGELTRGGSITIAQEMLRQWDHGALVYCRFGKQYMQNLEKQANSITGNGIGGVPLKFASYLINIKKLIKEHNIDSDQNMFKLKTKTNVQR